MSSSKAPPSFSAAGLLKPLPPSSAAKPAATAMAKPAPPPAPAAAAPKERPIPSKPDGRTIEDLAKDMGIKDDKEQEQKPEPKKDTPDTSNTPAGVSSREEASLRVFLDVLDEQDLGILLRSNPDGQEALKKANRFFTKVIRDERSSAYDKKQKQVKASEVLRSCEYVTSEWHTVRFELSERELFLAGPWGTPVKGMFPAEDHTEIYGIKLELRNVNSTIPLRLGNDEYVPQLGFTCIEHTSLMAYKNNFSKHAAALESSDLNERCPGRRMFFRELNPIELPPPPPPKEEKKKDKEEKKEEGPPVESYVIGGYSKAETLFCSQAELVYGIVNNLEGQEHMVYLPENHVLADQIKHSAQQLGIQAYRIYAQKLADMHPYNNIVMPDMEGKRDQTDSLCQPGNYLRLPKPVFDQAMGLFLSQRCYHGTPDHLVPIERLGEVGFFVGLVGEHYFYNQPGAAPADWRDQCAKSQPAWLQLSDEKRVLSFECRLTYAKKKSKPFLVDQAYQHPVSDKPVPFFSIGISQGAYPGEDQKVPIKDMCVPQKITPPAPKEGEPPLDKEKQLANTQIAFMTVPRQHLRGYLERKAAERRATKHSAAYAVILSTDQIVQKLAANMAS